MSPVSLYIYIYILISSCLVFVVFCTTGTPHIRIREDVLIQECVCVCVVCVCVFEREH